MGYPNPPCSRDSYEVTAGPDGSCCPAVAPERLREPRLSPARSTLPSPSHTWRIAGSSRAAEGFAPPQGSPHCHTLRQLPAPSSAQLISRARWTSRSSTAVGAMRANIPIAEVFNFIKGTTSTVKSFFMKKLKGVTKWVKHLWEAPSLFRETPWGHQSKRTVPGQRILQRQNGGKQRWTAGEGRL